MAEDVYEQHAGGLEPAGDAREQPLVVADVLEHLDGHHAIEAIRGVEDVDVGDFDIDVLEAAACGFRRDGCALGSASW
jgi:hypothetical protein